MTVSREIEPRALESSTEQQQRQQQHYHDDDATVEADNTDKSKTISTASHSSKSSSGSKKNNAAAKVSIQVDRTLLEELSQSMSRFEDDRATDDDENFEDSRLYLGPLCDIRRGCLSDVWLLPSGA